MLNRRIIRVLAAASIVIMSTVVCITSGSDVEELGRVATAIYHIEQTKTAQAEETEYERVLITQTARAAITQTAQASITPTPTPSPEPPSLPPVAFSLVAVSGNVTICESGEPANNPQYDILSLDFYPPVAPEDQWWRVVYDFGVPADEIYSSPYSFSVKAMIAEKGKSLNPEIVNEKLGSNSFTGVFDPEGNFIPGSEFRSYVDGNGLSMLVSDKTNQMTVFLEYRLTESGELYCDTFPWTPFDIPAEGP